MWRARPRPDDTGGFPFTTLVVTYVEWGDEAQHRQPRRLVKARTQPEEWLGLGQLVGAPWIYDEDSRRTPRARWHSSPKLADNEGLPFTVVVTPLVWADIDEPPKQRRRIDWRARPRPADNEGWPFNVLPTVFVEWADEPVRHRVLRVWRAFQQPNDISGFPFFVPVPPPPPGRVRTQPNGRWRSIIDIPYRYVIGDRNTMTPYRGEVGFTLFLDTGAAISPTVSGMKMTFTAPSGAQFSVGSDLFYAGVDIVAGALSPQFSFIAYTFGQGDLSEAGLWRVQMYFNGSPVNPPAQFFVTYS
jgi:hypothetical protein